MSIKILPLFVAIVLLLFGAHTKAATVAELETLGINLNLTSAEYTASQATIPLSSGITSNYMEYLMNTYGYANFISYYYDDWYTQHPSAWIVQNGGLYFKDTLTQVSNSDGYVHSELYDMDKFE